MIGREQAKALLQRLSLGVVWITKATPQSQVKELIATLRPYETSTKLIRLGPAGDGGYLVPDDLEGIAACISPGVSTESGFDFAVAERGIDVYMADASVDGPAMRHPKFHFEKKFFTTKSGETTTTIAEFCERIPGITPGADLMLQMDIEYAEYPVVLTMTPDLLKRFRIIVIELHGVENLFQTFGFGVMHGFFEKLLEHHHVVHLHPNNCCGNAVAGNIAVPRVLEMTLQRKDRARFTRDLNRVYPHPLDADNVPAKPSLVLAPLFR